MHDMECPYCGYMNDPTDIYECLDEDDNTCDWECGDCGEEFAVYVEFNPTYYTSPIEYVTCDCCGEESRDAISKKSCNPFPKELEDLTVCLQCYYKHMRKELNSKNK